MESPEIRLDKHALAIRALRKQVAALTEQMQALLGEKAPERPQETADGPSTGLYLPSSTCAMCGRHKGKRRALTCYSCGQQRTKIIKEGLDRTPIIRDNCFNCGRAFKPQARFLCTPCSKSYAEWKAA